jgi:hypothetical protein
MDVQLCKLKLVIAYRSIIQFDGDIGKPIAYYFTHLLVNLRRSQVIEQTIL